MLVLVFGGLGQRFLQLILKTLWLRSARRQMRRCSSSTGRRILPLRRCSDEHLCQADVLLGRILGLRFTVIKLCVLRRIEE